MEDMKLIKNVAVLPNSLGPGSWEISHWSNTEIHWWYVYDELTSTFQVEVHFPKGKLPNLSDDSEVKKKKTKTLSVEAKKKKLEAAQKDVKYMEARIEEIKQTWREQELVRLVYFYHTGLTEINAPVGPQEVVGLINDSQLLID